MAHRAPRPTIAYRTGWLPTWCAHRPATVSSAGLTTWVLRWIESLSIFVPARPSRPGQQRDGGHHRDGHHERHGGAHAADGGEPGEEQTEDGDHHGGAGEQHGLTGGGDGGAGGVLDAHALVQVLAVAGDDEQGVVDAHAEADHGAQDQRELGDVHDRREHADAGGADEDAEQRGRRSGGPSRPPSRTRPGAR